RFAIEILLFRENKAPILFLISQTINQI
ncbi:MAG: hypothetical protein ACI81T_001505, partial [Bacteroidia bacterium]